MKLAAVFPGQGSQSVGMLKELYEHYAVMRETFEEASGVLGYDCWKLIQEGPEEKLKQTQFTQPVMYVSDVAVSRVWLAAGGAAPDRVAGHSLAEYAALTFAGVMRFRECVQIVDQRARLMADAVPDGEGGMVAVIGLDDDKLIEICAELSNDTSIISAANFNSPGQLVISGHTALLQKAVDAAKAAGARKAMVLPVSVPNHSPLMQGANEALASFLDAAEVRSPEIPVVQNLEGKSYDSLTDIMSALKAQMAKPVRWTQSIQAMAASGVDVILELGPGKVLKGLTRRIDKSIQCECVQDLASLDSALEMLAGN